MKKRFEALLVLGLVMGLAAPALAQGYGAEQQQESPDATLGGSEDMVAAPVEAIAPADRLEYSQRGIALPVGTLRVDATFGLARLLPDAGTGTGIDTSSFLSFGAAFGLMDNLELGLSGYRQGALGTGVSTGAVPFQLTKDFGLGFVTPYARYRLLHDEMLQLAAELTIVLPTASHSDLGLMFGAPLRLLLAQMFAIDTGIFFQAKFADSTITDLVVPIGFIVNVMPALFLLARMQLIYSNFDIFVLGADFGGGYTLEGSDGAPMLDIMATFGFPKLLSDGDTFTDQWQFNIGASFRIGT